MKILLASRDVLYHITSQRSASAILQAGAFHLKPAIGTEAEEKVNRGRMFYLSTARYPNSDYFRNSLMSTSVVFELNGRAIGNNYKIVPVDYWEAKQHRDEAEERILSDRFELSIKYVRAVHLVPGTPHAERIRRQCVKLRIPVHAYSEAKQLLSLRPKDRVKMEPMKAAPATKYRAQRFKFGSSLAAWVELYERPMPTNDDVEMWEILKRRPLSKRGAHNRELLRYVRTDALRSLDADLHNAKAYHIGDGTSERENLHKVLAIMKKHGWSKLQFLQYLAGKWQPQRATVATVTPQILRGLITRTRSSIKKHEATIKELRGLRGEFHRKRRTLVQLRLNEAKDRLEAYLAEQEKQDNQRRARMNDAAQHERDMLRDIPESDQ